MSMAMRAKFAQQYANNYIETSVTEASPHKLVTLLYDGALKNISLIKVFFEQKNIEKRVEHLNKLIGILYGLKSGLDLETGGEVASNLNGLYSYMIQQALQSSYRDQPQLLDELVVLITDLKDSWQQMPAEYQNLTQDQLQKMRKQAGNK